MSEDEIKTVRLKLPPFWNEKPEIWFYQVEAQFRIEQIRSENNKFNHLVANLEPRILENIWDIITNDEIPNKYTAAKTRLLSIFKESDDKQLKKLLTGLELGDLKPSQLYRRMKSLSSGELSEKGLKTLWLEKLPDSIKNILVTVGHEDVEKLAEMADKILDMNPRVNLYNIEEKTMKRNQ